jgi:hypothetical protein
MQTAPDPPQPTRRQSKVRLSRGIADGTHASGGHLCDRPPCEQLDVRRSIVRAAAKPAQ